MLAGGKIAMKRSSPTSGSSDLKAALATLNEDTMAEACALLMTDIEDDHHKLMAILAKCQEANAIIQEHAIQIAAMPLFPLTRGSTPTAAPSVRQNTTTATTMMHPPRRTMMKAGTDRRAAAAAAAAPVKLLVRQESDSSITSAGSAASSHPKKPRLEKSAPPPEALSFLQALNPQKDKDLTTPTTANHQTYTRPILTMSVKSQPKRTTKR
jgi:hypothetical protein